MEIDIAGLTRKQAIKQSIDNDEDDDEDEDNDDEDDMVTEVKVLADETNNKTHSGCDMLINEQTAIFYNISVLVGTTSTGMLLHGLQQSVA